MFLDWFSRREKQVVSDQPVARQRLAMAPASYEAVEPETALAETDWRATERPVTPVIREPKRSEKPLTSQWPVAPLARPQRPEIVVKKFVLWLLEQGYRGEYRWVDIWNLYRLAYCQQVNERPLASTYQNMFAQQLAKFCKRDYYRELQNGKRRFYRTYHIQPLNEKMEIEMIQNAA